VVDLEVVGPQNPEVVLHSLAALFFDQGCANLEVSVIGSVVLDHARLNGLGLEASLGGVVHTAREVAVGADGEWCVESVEQLKCA